MNMPSTSPKVNQATNNVSTTMNGLRQRAKQIEEAAQARQRLNPRGFTPGTPAQVRNASQNADDGYELVVMFLMLILGFIMALLGLLNAPGTPPPG